jgi:hypothetical protein
LKKPLSLNKLIAVANKAYPDGMVAQNFNPLTGTAIKKNMGDSLAKFIVVELCETYDANASRKDQIAEAVRAMDTAIREMEAVRDAFLTMK